ncbi:MAG: dicarboxylate/amino acid:cation symporter [Candidatus Moduliflexus flocculans]|nr:dicarboxylate/amino acid:cation symporter [Candidatus Moduliflexus flocculans]
MIPSAPSLWDGTGSSSDVPDGYEWRKARKARSDWYFKSNLLARILIGLVLGAIVGIVLGLHARARSSASWTSSKLFGDLFVRLLKMIVVPVILFSLIAGAASIAPPAWAAWASRSWCTTCFTSRPRRPHRPGVRQHLQARRWASASWAPRTSRARRPPSSPWRQILLNIVPTNPVESLAKGDVLPIIFFAVVFGLAHLLRQGLQDQAAIAKGADTLFDVCNAAAETMYKVVGGIMQYAPIGVFVLIAIVFAQQGAKAIGPLLVVTLTVYLGLIVHLVGRATAASWRSTSSASSSSSSGANEAMVTAFVTRSSSGTLPITMRVTEEKLGVPRAICSFTLPLGATINMDGTAIYLGVCAMFIGYATGQPLTFNQQLTVIITATLASIGTAGVPGAGAIMLLMVLESIGLKVERGHAPWRPPTP